MSDSSAPVPALDIDGLGNGLITGLQGAGKSHFVMTSINYLLETTDLNIYLINVDGVKINHPRFTVADSDFNWIDDAPKNSLVIYDEAGTIDRFSNSSKTINSDPEVAQLTMLRHHGKQVFFVVQDPSILHPAVRRLMVRHLHFSNPYNDPKQTHCFVFPQVIDRLSATSKSWKKAAIKEFDHVLYPEIFPLYKSVDEGAKHVKKKQKNAKAQRVFIAVAVISVIAILVFIGAIFLGFSWYKDFNSSIDDDAVIDEAAATVEESTDVVTDVVDPIDPVDHLDHLDQRIDIDNARYAREQQLYRERLPADYQVLSRNSDIRVAAVISGNDVCIAYNQRGERFSLTDAECQSFVNVSKMIKAGSNARLITEHPPELSDDKDSQL